MAKKNKKKRKHRPTAAPVRSGSSGHPAPRTVASPAHPAPRPTGQIRLSQCMIVKNEERNIEKALAWAKPIACEQIVVDTGSTDRTVEIAEKMGAKIYHFEWIKDFAAAKNYAIEQAKGDWIAFLDADEYIPEDEVKRIMPLLELIQSDPKMRETYMAVNCPLVQLDDKGNPKDICEQERFFRNLPTIRYVGKIHEHLSLEEEDIATTSDFRIMHTGYTNETFSVTGKASRNVEFLRAKLVENPDDIITKAYLADALKAEAVVLRKNPDECRGDRPRASANLTDAATLADAKTAEAETLYKEVINYENASHPLLRRSAYEHFLYKYSSIPNVDPALEKIAETAFREFPDDHKFMCFYAMALNKRGDYAEAYEMLKKCESSLDAAEEKDSALTMKIMELLSTQMIVAAQGLGDLEKVILYAGILLLMNKTDAKILQPYIATLVKHYETDEEIFAQLSSIYDLKSKTELLFVARAAKDCGAIELARKMMDLGVRS